jgi:hypothetical protein
MTKYVWSACGFNAEVCLNLCEFSKRVCWEANNVTEGT